MKKNICFIVFHGIERESEREKEIKPIAIYSNEPRAHKKYI